MGLFGQPELSSDDPSRPTFRTMSIPHEYRVHDASGGEGILIQNKVIKFFNRYSFKDASPLLTKIWTDVAANDSAAANIAWLASGGLKKERMCFYASEVADNGSSFYLGTVLKDIVKNERECDKPIRAFDRRVGFTFLVFQNDSDDVLTDVHFKYRQNYYLNPIKEDFPEPPNSAGAEYFENIPSSGSPVVNLVSKYGSASDAESKLLSSPTEELFAARVEPRQRLIALLNVYVAGQYSFPGGLLKWNLYFRRS